MKSKLELASAVSQAIAEAARALTEKRFTEAETHLETASALNAELCDHLADEPVPFSLPENQAQQLPTH